MKSNIIKISVLLSLCVQISSAGVWEKVLSFGDDEIKSTSYDVEAKGWNFRVYEFIPVNATNKLCIVVTSDDKGIQMECFDNFLNR